MRIILGDHRVVMLTQVDMSDYYNIAYKDISEDM